MTPVILTLIDNSEILVHVEDAARYMEELEKFQLDLIESIEPAEEAPTPLVDAELTDVDLILIDGSVVQCSVFPTEVEAIEQHPLVRSCSGVEAMCKLRSIGAVEKELDRRMLATYAVINNIPTLSRRARLHEQYIKRKTAYVVSMEALVDGAFRD